ncbi:MarR family winged helix-turn-helix transcriptional regulator [Leuconostoc palmae]|uniref:MarR family winged helix-turn-helix transcriptional regulator n=1 Tax=Leuconostoc palmae TaxID=501487 RepID=UPI001C7D9A2D|nr:MarR family transcriptional regulator [Leuconostoc palmae]
MTKIDLMNDFINVYMASLKHLEKLISQPTNVYGISFEQWLIMSAVAKNESKLTMTEIATDRNVTKGAVARQLKPLVALAYIEQIPDKKDRRRVLLSLTDKGKEVEKAITNRVVERFDKWLSVYGLEEGELLLNQLRRLETLIVKPELDTHDD